jgi:hypothetical protein
MDSLFIVVPFDSMSSVTRRLGAHESLEETYRTCCPSCLDPLLHRQIMRDMIYRVLLEKNKNSPLFLTSREALQRRIAPIQYSLYGVKTLTSKGIEPFSPDRIRRRTHSYF